MSFCNKTKVFSCPRSWVFFFYCLNSYFVALESTFFQISYILNYWWSQYEENIINMVWIWKASKSLGSFSRCLKILFIYLFLSLSFSKHHIWCSTSLHWILQPSLHVDVCLDYVWRIIYVMYSSKWAQIWSHIIYQVITLCLWPTVGSKILYLASIFSFVNGKGRKTKAFNLAVISLPYILISSLRKSVNNLCTTHFFPMTYLSSSFKS